MKYYQNKTTGEIIGVENLRELLTFPTEQSIQLGFKGYSRQSIVDVIMPNKLLGNGVKTYNMPFTFLKANYKRINKKIALAKYPNFHQYDYEDLQMEKAKTKLEGIVILMKQTI